MARTQIDRSLIASINSSANVATTTNDNAAAGIVGEVVSSLVTAEVTGSTTMGTFTDTGNSIVLTPGDWDVNFGGVTYVVCNSGSALAVPFASLRLTDNANVTQIESVDGMYVTSTTPYFRKHTGYKRISISGSTTYKLRFGAVANSGSPTITSCLFEVSAASPGYLTARRAR